MIDINIYRSRIGRFSPRIKVKPVLRRQYSEIFSRNINNSGKKTQSFFRFFYKLVIILVLGYSYPASICDQDGLGPLSLAVQWVGAVNLCGFQQIREENHSINSEIINHNFQARYLKGNIQKQKIKGILNMHLNIRSLRYKVYEVKQIVEEYNPTMIGLS